MRLAIAYLRVSTSKQGKSGLGLEAQLNAIRLYCSANGIQLLLEIIEVKSTRKNRPRLQEAFALCRKHKALLIVARLDRLGRDVEEIAHNVKRNIEIVVVDNPQANRFTIHILAAVAEEQRRTISVNTKQALQAAKMRGIELGKNGKILSVKNKLEADAFAQKLKPVLNGLAAEGHTSIRKIVAALNAQGVETFRPGAKWHRTTVCNLLERLSKTSNAQRAM